MQADRRKADVLNFIELRFGFMVTAATIWDILDSAKNLITVRDFIKFLEHMSTPNGSFVDSMDHKKKVLLWDCNDGEAAEFTVSHPKCIIRWNLWKLLANFLFKEGECVRVALQPSLIIQGQFDGNNE